MIKPQYLIKAQFALGLAMCLIFAVGGGVVVWYSGRLLDAADSSMKDMDSNIRKTLVHLDQSDQVLARLEKHMKRGGELALDAKPFVEGFPGRIKDIKMRAEQLAEVARQAEEITSRIAGQLPLKVPTGINIEWTKYPFPKPFEERYISCPSGASVVRKDFLADEKKTIKALNSGFADLKTGLQGIEALAGEGGPFIKEKALPFLDNAIAQMETATTAVSDFSNKTMPTVKAYVERFQANLVKLRQSLVLIRWLAVILVVAGVLLSLYMIVNAVALRQLITHVLGEN